MTTRGCAGGQGAIGLGAETEARADRFPEASLEVRGSLGVLGLVFAWSVEAPFCWRKASGCPNILRIITYSLPASQRPRRPSGEVLS